MSTMTTVKSTKSTKPVQPSRSPDVPAASPAKVMQEQSEAAAPKTIAPLSITLRAESGYEYNLDLPRDVVEKLLDPDVGDGFIEVPACSSSGQRLTGARRFLHTAFVKEIDVRGL